MVVISSDVFLLVCHVVSIWWSDLSSRFEGRFRVFRAFRVFRVVKDMQEAGYWVVQEEALMDEVEGAMAVAAGERAALMEAEQLVEELVVG